MNVRHSWKASSPGPETCRSPSTSSWRFIGAIGGFVYGIQQPEHHPQYLYAIFGGFIGFILIPAVALLIRFAIQCVIVGLLLLAVYYAFIKP